MKTLKKIIEFGVTEAIFERGWIEQSPEEFIYAAREEILPLLSEAGLSFKPEELGHLILEELSNQLGSEYDVNVYRLGLFPSEFSQEYDI